MKITFIKHCPPCWDSGWSEYHEGDKADLVRGAQLVKRQFARDGWGELLPEPTTEPKPKRRRTRKKAA